MFILSPSLSKVAFRNYLAKLRDYTEKSVLQKYGTGEHIDITYIMIKTESHSRKLNLF